VQLIGERAPADQHRRTTLAMRGAVWSSVLNVVGMPIDLMIARDNGMPWWPNLFSIATGVALLGVLVLRRKQASVRLGSAIFLANAAVIIVALWFGNAAYAASGRPWAPFQANKLGMVTVALLASEPWVGVLGVAGYAGSAIVQELTFPPAVQRHIAMGEPWASVAIGVFALALFVYRIRRESIERHLVQREEEAAVLRRFTDLVLEVRDLSNTPLQTIALSSALIRAERPELRVVLDRVDRALARLKALDAKLTRFTGGQGGEASRKKARAVSVV
jgi:hypothetical protein